MVCGESFSSSEPMGRNYFVFHKLKQALLRLNDDFQSSHIGSNLRKKWDIAEQSFHSEFRFGATNPALRAALLSVMPHKKSFYTTKLPKIMSQSLECRTKVHRMLQRNISSFGVNNLVCSLGCPIRKRATTFNLSRPP